MSFQVWLNSLCSPVPECHASESEILIFFTFYKIHDFLDKIMQIVMHFYFQFMLHKFKKTYSKHIS